MILSVSSTDRKVNGTSESADKEAREQVEILVKQMAERQGVTEKMKEENQMEWVGRMNGIKASVEEIVFQQLIYI